MAGTVGRQRPLSSRRDKNGCVFRIVGVSFGRSSKVGFVDVLPKQARQICAIVVPVASEAVRLPGNRVPINETVSKLASRAAKNQKLIAGAPLDEFCGIGQSLISPRLPPLEFASRMCHKMPEKINQHRTSILEVRAENISCRRGELIVLAGLSFALQPGDCLLLVGPNGVGKTTLIRTLAGLSSIVKGTLLISDEEIAYVGHLNGINLQLTVSENLRFWGEVLGSPVDKTTVRDFGLHGLGHQPARHLSTGQLRRLSVAAAVASNRRILLLDEPFAALDPNFSRALSRALSNHLERGGIAVMSSHAGASIAGAFKLDLTPYRCQDFMDAELFGEQVH